MAAESKQRESQVPELVEEKVFSETIVSIDRVARVVKGGRRFRFRALVVVGDGRGQIGMGVAKGGDVQAAVTKATEAAKREMVTVSLNKGTIPHDIIGRVGGARIFLKPASEGTGLIAGGVVRSVLEAVGVKNILSKSLGSSNKINVAYATIAALQATVPAEQWLTNAPKVSKKATEKVKG
jgi:small subunit ribosomal protein S5